MYGDLAVARTSVVSDILHPSLCVMSDEITSKKKLFESASSLFAGWLSDDDDVIEDIEEEVYHKLIAREKLGCTAVGQGIAIPHGRIENIDTPALAVIRVLGDTLVFDNDEKIWIAFCLIVPEYENQRHLEVYAALMRELENEDFQRKLKQASNTEQLYQLLLSI